MAKQLVSDLQAREKVDGLFSVRQKRLASFRNKPGHYLDLTLADRTGEITARMWDRAEEADPLAQIGGVIHVTGRVDEYQGRLQIIIDKLAAVGEDEYDPGDFLGSGKRDTGELEANLLAVAGSVENVHLRSLLQAFFGDDAFVRRFAQSPASKQLHHAHIGGLLEHTLSVVRILETTVELHPELDRDLLVAGALLHDVGKVEELEVLGTTIDYSDVGRLVGHIVLTDRMVTERIAAMGGMPDELARRLTHLLLSHHGQKEYGAPVLPMTPEACALHYADNLDAHVQYFSEVVERGAPGNRWSEYQRLFDRYIYLGDRGTDGDE